jgi:hypothetical protein
MGNSGLLDLLNGTGSEDKGGKKSEQSKKGQHNFKLDLTSYLLYPFSFGYHSDKHFVLCQIEIEIVLQ